MRLQSKPFINWGQIWLIMKIMEKIKYIYRAYRYKYLVDAPEINFIQQNLKKGDVAVDIGCHKGGYLYWLQQGVTYKGQVYAFEPQPKLYSYLKGISNTLSYDNVVIENKGLSVRHGKVDFHIPMTKSGTSPGARIDAAIQNKKDIKLEIEVVTLDDYFYERQIFPNLIKIDVEGHEKQVLLGGIRLLKYCHPTLLLECENRHLHQGETIFDVFKILLDIGYQGYFYENKSLKSISEFDLECHQRIGEGRFWEEKGYVNNFIFMK